MQRIWILGFLAVLLAGCALSPREKMERPGMPGYVSQQIERETQRKQIRVEPAPLATGGFALGFVWNSEMSAQEVLVVAQVKGAKHLVPDRPLELIINGETVKCAPVSEQGYGRTYYNPAQEHAVSEKLYHTDITTIERVMYAQEARALVRTYTGGMEDFITLSEAQRKRLKSQAKEGFSPLDYTAYANFRKLYQLLQQPNS